MKVSQKKYQYFVDECKRWLEVFGCGDWLVDFELYKCSQEERVAETYMNMRSRKATIRLSTILPHHALEDTALSRTACHEVLHIVLFPLTHLLDDYVSFTHYDGLEHGVIMRVLKGLGFKYGEI